MIPRRTSSTRTTTTGARWPAPRWSSRSTARPPSPRPTSASSPAGSTSGRAGATAATAAGARRRWPPRSRPTAFPGYEVRAYETRQDALSDAARAIEATGAPVILLTWRGAHTWVMTGFRADADPAIFDDARISGVYIQDPWYPGDSSIWGQSDPPGNLEDTAEMRRNYLPWAAARGQLPRTRRAIHRGRAHAAARPIAMRVRLRPQPRAASGHGGCARSGRSSSARA